ncbi:CsgG/HfaB family protein [Gilvimarinus agarilyticus]|uniref:CsgG/HfaB family protein n=1 Tax=unclassified Gilvimarinus TaxID=2642066 RepID=UPI001C089C16|nr:MULTISPECIES: CsgG/HfaB family protein [unclassified Gilvimarinus]MBU2884549.1 CsgG/HfaB family protein [Gilvimarinus agarilyticus]MDO6569677.1 CsgG/HfaB family protein [Gilvimarinus sp. 2_MG-2023]MDO6747996.1 CsgG/HfaB family protein [Gilvimarinus sp. 1_MG-2023]
MRLKHWGIWLAAIFCVAVAPLSWAGPRVAVVDFENKSQHGGWRVGRGAADMLTTELVKGTNFDIFERDRLNSIMQEQNFGSSGRVDTATAAKIGKIIGVQYIVTGSVTEYGQSSSGGGGGGINVGKKGYHASVDVRVVDVNTSRILFADTGNGHKASMNVRVFGFGGGESWNEKSATEAMRGAINELVTKLDNADFASSTAAAQPAGPVLLADVAGSDIILNAGSGAGLKSGQTLTVKRKGREIKDPATGAVLKVTYKTIGKIKLTSAESSYAEATVVSGSDFKVGDIAEP